MSKIRCASCGREVLGTSFSCPYCGFDVRAIKAHGNGCWNCRNHSYCSDYNAWNGPDGYPCLEWDEAPDYD